MTLRAGRYVFDTSILVAVLRGESDLAAKLLAVGEATTCAIVEAELLYGAACSSKREANESSARRVLALLRIVPADSRLAPVWASLKNELRLSGRMIPDNDIWVAACAMAEGATLVSRDAHFNEVDGLAREEW